MATENCDYRLAADIAANCGSPSVKGIKDKGYIVNYDDVDWNSCVKDSANPNIYTSIVLKTGKRGYAVTFPGKTPFKGTKTTLTAGTYRNNWTKDVTLVVFNNGPEVAHDIIDQLANGTFIVILENKYGGTDGKNTFEVYGSETGLSASAIDNDKYSEDTEGGWLVNLQETGAPSSAVYLYSTSIEATRTALASLLTASTGN